MMKTREKALKRLLKLAAILGFVATITTGCAVNRATGSVDPAANLSALKTMYVKKIPAEDGGTNELIADKLRSKGITVTTGEGTPPDSVDAVVTYVDKWMWDITMYMLELTITSQINAPHDSSFNVVYCYRYAGTFTGRLLITSQPRSDDAARVRH
jgi:hypothetical protein